MNTSNITNTALVVIVAWLLSANFSAARNNFKESNNILATPITVFINNLTEDGLTRAYSAKFGLGVAALKNALTIGTTGAAIRITNAPVAADGFIDSFEQQGKVSVISGWAYVDEPPPTYFVVERAGEIISATPIGGFRPDVKQALGKPRADRSGFTMRFDGVAGLSRCDYTYHVVSQNLKIYSFNTNCQVSDQGN